MRPSHPTEQAVGIDHYVSDADGIGGRIREAAEDFRVREIETVEPEPLDADPDAYRHLLVRATLRGWDTNDFARELADRIGMSRERVSWAGTKDKRAVTTQLFSVEDVSPDELPPIRDADLEPVGRFGRRLLFGDLAGNAFEIAVRDPEDPDAVDAITDDLRAFGDGTGDDADAAEGTVGVPNFFGVQRFGSVRPVTHVVGLRLARDDWKGAVMAYVGEPHEEEPEDTRDARRYVEETEDWSGAIERFPGGLRYERAMLHSLAASGGEEAEDFRAALETAPSNLQRLFVNAAQSFAFNRILSARLDRGLPFDRAVEGDVVCFAEERGDLVVPDPDRLQRVDAGRVDAVNRHVERGRAFVTAPLVGTETELGDGRPGDIERKVLEDLDLAPGDFDLPGEFGSTGTRRAVLVRTDLDVTRDPLRLAFALPKGSYATVLLREYLKVPPGELG